MPLNTKGIPYDASTSLEGTNAVRDTVRPSLPLPEDEHSTVDAALASLKLEPMEISFLASPEIGAVASKSPRAVKRLINIYRIVRARLSNQELEEFLGHTGSAPRYPIAALLAAIETGQPIELAENFYPVLRNLTPDARVFERWTAKIITDLKPADATRVMMARAGGISPALVPALKAVDDLCGTRGAQVSSYLAIARQIRRYSFNRYD
jgi:hypothetical protein